MHAEEDTFNGLMVDPPILRIDLFCALTNLGIANQSSKFCVTYSVLKTS
jgi:hypothetical protein